MGLPILNLGEAKTLANIFRCNVYGRQKNTNPECWIVQLNVGLYVLSNLDYWTEY